jgi:hypothetical protein
MRCHYEKRKETRATIRAGAILICVAGALLPRSIAQGMQSPAAFTIVGSQFHQRAPEDAGEARVCIQNTGERTLSMADLKIQVLAQRADSSGASATECQCVYAKLSPPVLPPGAYGEVVAKLMDRPMGGHQLTCNLFAADGAISQAVPLIEPPLWISFVGFSEDLRRVFVYVENPGSEPVEAQLLRVGQFDMADRAKAIHAPIPPKDKGCLIGELPSPVAAGAFVHIVVATNTDGRQSQMHAVIRAIHRFFVVMEGGSGDPRLGLDAQWPFVQTMACPAHAHGSHEQAAAKFLADYTQRFSQDPSQVIQMHLCRSDMTRAWFRFGNLPDVAVMNTCLRPSLNYDKDPQKWFCPFFCTGALAKRVTEPGRNVALIHTGPDAEDEGSFLHKELTSQEWRFLVYCAVASGAKGIIYRGPPKSDPLVGDAFRQLNRQLQHLNPFLLIAEPVEWATADGSGYAVKSLLCGDQAVLIVVFDCRYFSRKRNGRLYTPPFARTVSSVRVHMRIPASVTVQDVAGVLGSLDRSSWAYQNGNLDFTADMVDSAQVYIASLRRQTKLAEKGRSP